MSGSIDLGVLGTVDLQVEAGHGSVGSVLAQHKRMALLCYLALARPRGLHARETLLSIFWPEATAERARNSLNQAVFMLRRSLGEDAITGSAEELRIGDRVRCDAVAFDQALERGERRRAIDLYGGTLMSGFHLDGCPGFERWLDGERDRLRSLAVEAALAEADTLEQAGNPFGAAELLRRASLWAPWNERVVGRHIGLLAAAGDPGGALHAFDGLRRLFETELGMAPSPELEKLVRSIREPSGTAARTDPPRPDAAARDAIAPLQRPGIEAPAGTPPDSRRVPAAIATVALLAIALTALLKLPPPPGFAGDPGPDGRRVLVATFENRSGDASLDPVGIMAADWTGQTLARSGLARVVPISTVLQESATEPGAAGASASPADVRLARQLGAGLLVSGAYYQTGGMIVFQARVVDVATGSVVRAVEEVRAPSGDPAAAVDELARRSVGAIAALLDDRLGSDPVNIGLPSTLEAYRAFAGGMTAFVMANRRWGTPEGVQQNRQAAASFLEAAALDTAFTTALIWAVYASLHAADSARADSIVQRVRERPLGAWARAATDHQTALLTGNAEAAFSAAAVLAELSPDSEWLLTYAIAAAQTGRSRAALDALRRVDPERGWMRSFTSYWRIRVQLQHTVGNYQAALSDARRGLADNPGDRWLRTQELWALAALGRSREITERTRTGIVDGDAFALWELGTVAEELRGHGHGRAADRLLANAIRMAEPAVAGATPAMRGNLAFLYYRAGRHAEAETRYAALTVERPGDAEFRARRALLAARRGDPIPAFETRQWLESLQGDALARAAPAGQLAYWGSHEGWKSLTAARLLVAVGEPDRAVEALQSALQQGLGHAYLHLHDDPDFDPIRALPAFRRLLRDRSPESRRGS
jgi:DNA-binding SARP family transcriptional activator